MWLLIMANAMPAAADCNLPPPIAVAVKEADIVFVGVVQALANQDRWAQVRVDEVWRGEVAVPTTEVRGGSNPRTASSIDRTYVLGGRYLFVLSFHGGELVDNQCSATTFWDPAMAAHRPAQALTAPPTTRRGLDNSIDVGLVAGAALSVALVGLVVFGFAVAFRRP
jgi:hypothetical protein